MTMKQLFEDFYYLFFPKDEEGVYKTGTDSSLWVKILVVAFIGFMCFKFVKASSWNQIPFFLSFNST